jgi:uncharacterized membrane protein
MTNTTLKYRITSIDLLRGIVMLIMAIDHVRDALHKGHPEPTDLSVTTPILFFTRYITHFCAPTFVFLSGVSAFLAGTRRTKDQQFQFLIKRGIWLLIVEVLVITFAITLNPHYNYIILQVIWAIGGSMILLGLLIKLNASPKIIGIIGLLIFVGHNIFDIINPGPISKTVAWQLLISGNGWAGEIPIDHNHVINAPYALLPWTGVMLMGYAVGPLYTAAFNAAKRKKILLSAGTGMLIFFFIFRAFNIYGDPAPWSAQKTTALTIISFFNVTKYPCSLLYLCMTLGAALITLSRTEGLQNRITSIFSVYGSVPFFYYVCHWYLIQLITITLFFSTGHTSSQIVTPGNPIMFAPPDFGISLAGVYLVWLVVITLLYKPCKHFSEYKKTRRQWWLSYI